MISVDTSKTSDDLQKYIADVERRLKSMVAGFAYELTVKLVEATPQGNSQIVYADPDELSGPERAYYNLYLTRAEQYPDIAAMQTGYHKSAWSYSEDGTFRMIQGDPFFDSEERVLSQAQSSYRLGETFYIGGKGFGGDTNDSFLALENGSSDQAREGIKAPAWRALSGVYLVDLKRYYNEG